MDGSLETSQAELKGQVITIPIVDKTLTKAGHAADAKAVGDALETRVKTVDFEAYQKKFGTYKGNGSTESRTVEIAGTGKMLLICSESYFAYVTADGAVLTNAGDATSSKITMEQVYFSGDLYLNTDHEAFNKADETYNYQVI